MRHFTVTSILLSAFLTELACTYVRESYKSTLQIGYGMHLTKAHLIMDIVSITFNCVQIFFNPHDHCALW